MAQLQDHIGSAQHCGHVCDANTDLKFELLDPRKLIHRLQLHL